MLSTRKSAVVFFGRLSAPLLLSMSILGSPTNPAGEPKSVESTAISPEAEVFFEKQVRPLLVERCYKCHSEKKQSGGLRLDHRALVLAGGESGPAITPGKPEESLLVEAINYESLEMPPKGKLPPRNRHPHALDQAALPWPHDDFKPSAVAAGNKISDEDRRWWAFQPVRSVAPPAYKNDWARNDVDRFVGVRLASAGLTPAPKRRTWC